MIRVVSSLSIACVVGGVALAIANDSGEVRGVGAILIVLSLLIGAFLGARAMVLKARQVVSAVTNLASGGGPNAARLVEVGEPKGIFFPKSNVVLELVAADGQATRLDQDLSVPFPYAWGYRLSKRFNLPLIGRRGLGEMLAFELRREGMKVDEGRPETATE